MIATQMEATFCRAYNASKAHRLGLRITVADCAGEPFKLMKVILDGLAQNPEAAFWLTNVQYTPQIVRIFPLDFAYLDPDLNILDAVELPPGVPLPRFHPLATSALIMPLGYLASNKSVAGDRLMICPEDEFEMRLADLRPSRDNGAAEPVELKTELEPQPAATEIQEPAPFFTQQTTLPVQAPVMSPGSGFTLALASTWQVATATTRAMPVEVEESRSSKPDTASSEAAGEEAPGAAEFDALTIVEEPAVEPPTIDLAHIAVLGRALSKFELHATPELDQSISIPEIESAKPVLRATEELIARSKEAAEKSYVKVSRPAAPRGKKSKKKQVNQQQRKEHIGNKVVRWLALDEQLPERRKIIRLLLQGLQAYESSGDGRKRYNVRDICPPGLYIQTDEAWEQGDTVSLVLVKEGVADRDSEHRVRIRARVVRRDHEGVAVAFVFPEGTDFQPWQRVKTKRYDETEADFILRELRLARALGFLRRLCPWAANEVNHALLERLSNKRVSSAVEIALQAEDMLYHRGHVAQPFVASEVIVRIIEGGSWIDEDWIRRLWAGLLVSSCSADGQDRTNLPFIDLLARLTPIHLRILSFACRRALEALAAGVSEAALNLYSTSEELMEAADSHSFPRIQQTIGQLGSVGLLAESARPSYVALSDKSKTRTTPTALGLRMFARCSGHQS